MRNRIRQLMEYEGMNAAQFSKKVNINTSVLSHLLGGRNNPSYDIVVKIIENCPEINVEWFMRGVGPMLKDGAPASSPVMSLASDTNTPAGSDMKPESTAGYPDLFGERLSPPKITAPKVPEIAKPRPVVRSVPEYSRENAVQQPVNTDRPIETQQDNGQSKSTRKITKIVVFYSDNSYEEFSSQRS